MHPPQGKFHKRAAVCVVFALSLLCGCKQSEWKLWRSFSTRFIDDQGRVIDPRDGRTTSRGQAYSMFFALVDNDRPRFNRIFGWTNYNLAYSDLGPHLPARLWGKANNGAWKMLDPNSEADADIWIAYTLLEAGRLWGEPGYTAMGQKLMKQIAAQDVADLPGFGPMLLSGNAGLAHNGAWTLNPSYLPVFIFERLAAVDSLGPWEKIAARISPLIGQSSSKGYAMDWVHYLPDEGFSPSAQPFGPGASSAPPPIGGGDAIRVYLWTGMLDEHDSARAAMLNALPSMGSYLASHDAPPESVSGDGIPSDTLGSVGFSAAVLPYLRANPGSAKILVKQLMRVRSERDPTTGLYGEDVAYDDQVLALFATGFLDKRFRFGPHGELIVGWKRP